MDQYSLDTVRKTLSYARTHSDWNPFRHIANTFEDYPAKVRFLARRLQIRWKAICSRRALHFDCRKQNQDTVTRDYMRLIRKLPIQVRPVVMNGVTSHIPVPDPRQYILASKGVDTQRNFNATQRAYNELKAMREQLDASIPPTLAYIMTDMKAKLNETVLARTEIEKLLDLASENMHDDHIQSVVDGNDVTTLDELFSSVNATVTMVAWELHKARLVVEQARKESLRARQYMAETQWT